jgi:hypothetical protein
MTCNKEEVERVLLRVNGVWEPYFGSTSLRKLYYRAYAAKKTNSSKFYVYEFSEWGTKVTGAIFPNKFWKSLSCTSIDGVDAHNLPHMILLDKQKCDLITLGDGTGLICTYCGKRSSK